MPRMHSVTVHRHSGPLVRPFVTAVRVAHKVDAVLVEVCDSDGRSGWGEAPTGCGWRHCRVRFPAAGGVRCSR
jgi:L-alanine-DL-glutamate epimerase-like enolase superfamily enzyme